MGVILQVALPSRELAAARLQCGAAGAGASRGLGVCAEHARLAARGESRFLTRDLYLRSLTYIVGRGSREPPVHSQRVPDSSPER